MQQRRGAWVGVAIIARQHSCNYGESKNHWSKYCRKEEHNYHRRVSSITKLLLSSSEFRRGEKVIDLHINQATFNRTETSKSSWKNWLEDKSIGATIYVSRTLPHLKYCPFAPGVSYWVSKHVWTWTYQPYFQKLQKLGQLRLVDTISSIQNFCGFLNR